MTDYQRFIKTRWWVHNAHDLRAPRQLAANDTGSHPVAGRRTTPCVSPLF